MDLPIETERLALRCFRLEDAPDLLELASHPSVSRAIPELEPTEAGVRRYLERLLTYEPFEPGKVFDLAIERTADRKVVGLLTLVRKGPAGAIGWVLGVDARKQGYALEAAAALLDYAFASLGMARIEAETSARNTPSWKLMERLGMRREASVSRGTAEGGQPLDSYVYALGPEDWRAARLSPAVPAASQEADR